MKRLTYYIVVILSASLLLFTNCQKADKSRNIGMFYFPIQELKEPKVYEYAPLGNDSLAPQYWYYQSIDQDTAFYFSGQFYDHSFRVQQFFREEVVPTGTLMQEYFLYPVDSSGKQLRQYMEIIYPNVFPFKVRDTSGIFLFKIQWQDVLYPGRTTTLTRNRRYVGDAEYAYKGQLYECIMLELKELIEIEEEGFQEVRYNGIELYAKGIGLIYYRKEISEGFVLEYELKDIYPMKQLEKKFSGYLQQ